MNETPNNLTEATGAPTALVPDSFWQRRIVQPVMGQLKQGLTPEKAALTIGLGVVLSIFPVLGTTTTLCLLVGALLKLNHPILQLINWLMAGVQLLLIPVCIRIGEKIVSAKPVAFSISDMLARFKASPTQFLQDFGMTGLHAILAWLVFAPFIAWGLYVAFLPVVRRLSRKA